MSVMCSMCGRESQDREFCDHCNADLGTAGQSLPPESAPVCGETVPLTLEQRHALLFPEASVRLTAGERGWRVHWISDIDWRDRSKKLENRLALRIAALPPGEILEDSCGRWLIFETPKEPSVPWHSSPSDDPLDELKQLSACVHSLVHALESLHQNSLVWLNFDPNMIEDVGTLGADNDESASADWRLLRIANLDVDLFPFQSMPDRVRVHPHYAAPEIVQFRVDDIGPRTDVFHLGMFVYYWLSRQLPDGLPGNGLESFGYALPFLRIYAPNLPLGVVPIVARALSIRPRDRQAGPRALAHALDEAIINAYARRSSTVPIRWDLAGQTRTGRAKAAFQRSNEDTILVKDDGQSAFALVADGVSTCDIGSGGLASTMTSICMENALADGCSHDAFGDVVGAAARRGSQGLLEWAIAHDCQADLLAGRDLMGTTLTISWLQGRELSLANLGDSRAYMITDHLVEQLTVDGDLASDLLTRGASPEEVRGLGVMARALRECVGGCLKTDDGQLVIMPESCTPRVSRWPLLPGDVVVLCSDGLVEEGFFLEPARLADLVHQFKDRSAAELASILVEAADAMQRLPSILEPEGFGDNISCIVIKIEGAV